MDRLLGVECNALLKALSARGVRCWLDSGSLLGLVRDGRLNTWEKDIDLGIWAEDLPSARSVCRDISREYDLLLLERRLRGLPYAFSLKRILPNTGSRLPIAVRVFYRMENHAWSPHPHPLIRAKWAYPRYVFRKMTGENSGLTAKIGFVCRHPRYGFHLFLSRFSLTQRLGRILAKMQRTIFLSDGGAEATKHPADLTLGSLFYDLFQWRIPYQFFENLRTPPGFPSYLLVPSPVEEYLARRYGEWRTPVRKWLYVVDDRCISHLSKKQLREILHNVSSQVIGK